MGEGNTPLVPSIFDGKTSFKLEFANPTGSFKDRGSTVEVSFARQGKYDEVICASTGNMGASIAAYAARAGIKATICLPENVPLHKISQIQAYGARLVKVKGDYNQALKKTWALASHKKNAMLTGDYPLRMEGQKTLAYELVDQCRGKIPRQIIVPIGNGTLITALFAGFREMKERKTIPEMPRLIGVQAAACAPLYHAWKKKTLRFDPISRPKTMAGAIACGNPIYGQEALMSVNASGGTIFTVSEARLKQAKVQLAEREGLYSEYSGAATYAVLNDHPWKGKTIVILGGHGLKE